MAVDLYAFVGMYSRVLDVLSHLLTRGAEFAASKGVSEADMLGWRLAPDMFDLRQQATSIAYFGPQWIARAAGLPLPPALEGEVGIAEIQAGIARNKAFLATVTAEMLTGRDAATLTVDLGAVEPTMPMGQWIAGFATPNVYFHLAMLYAILRNQGLPLGKRDWFAGGF